MAASIQGACLVGHAGSESLHSAVCCCCCCRVPQIFNAVRMVEAASCQHQVSAAIQTCCWICRSVLIPWWAAKWCAASVEARRSVSPQVLPSNSSSPQKFCQYSSMRSASTLVVLPDLMMQLHDLALPPYTTAIHKGSSWRESFDQHTVQKCMPFLNIFIAS